MSVRRGHENPEHMCSINRYFFLFSFRSLQSHQLHSKSRECVEPAFVHVWFKANWPTPLKTHVPCTACCCSIRAMYHFSRWFKRHSEKNLGSFLLVLGTLTLWGIFLNASTYILSSFDLVTNPFSWKDLFNDLSEKRSRDVECWRTRNLCSVEASKAVDRVAA